MCRKSICKFSSTKSYQYKVKTPHMLVCVWRRDAAAHFCKRSVAFRSFNANRCAATTLVARSTHRCFCKLVVAVSANAAADAASVWCCCCQRCCTFMSLTFEIASCLPHTSYLAATARTYLRSYVLHKLPRIHAYTHSCMSIYICMCILLSIQWHLYARLRVAAGCCGTLHLEYAQLCSANITFGPLYPLQLFRFNVRVIVCFCRYSAVPAPKRDASGAQ